MLVTAKAAVSTPRIERGEASIGLDKNVKMAVESCYGSVTTRVVFTSKRMLPVARKDVLPTTLKSSVVYMNIRATVTVGT